jgi:hypothetical protein
MHPHFWHLEREIPFSNSDAHFFIEFTFKAIDYLSRGFAELKVVEDVLHVRGESIEVGLEVGLELLLAGAGFQIAQRELRGVVESLTGSLPKRLVLMDDAGLIQGGFHCKNSLLGGLQQRIEPPQHRHGQDDVAILAAYIEIAQHVVRNAPDEIGDPVEFVVFHQSLPSLKTQNPALF